MPAVLSAQAVDGPVDTKDPQELQNLAQWMLVR